jgi:AcrR family transcriptional regulator
VSERSSGKRPTLRTRQREAAAEAILDAAEDVALDRGLESTTIAEIAERAGVAVGTLYNYFPDRDGILAALFAARRAELVPQMATAAQAAAHLPFEDRLRTFAVTVQAMFEANRRFFKLAVEVDLAALPKLKDRHPALMTLFIQSLEDIMQLGVARKLFGADRVPVLARLLQGAFKAVTLWRLERGEPIEVDAHTVVDTFLRGVQPGARA